MISDRTLFDALLSFLDTFLGDGRAASEIASSLGGRGMPGADSASLLSNAACALLGDVQGESVNATEAGVTRNLAKYVNKPGTSQVLRLTGLLYTVESV